MKQEVLSVVTQFMLWDMLKRLVYDEFAAIEIGPCHVHTVWTLES